VQPWLGARPVRDLLGGEEARRVVVRARRKRVEPPCGQAIRERRIVQTCDSVAQLLPEVAGRESDRPHPVAAVGQRAVHLDLDQAIGDPHPLDRERSAVVGPVLVRQAELVEAVRGQRPVTGAQVQRPPPRLVAG
jgi:hypothetical protein